jgi:Icc-related predicted phosphoesterase
MTGCFFVSDLHGKTDRYRKLFRAVSAERPKAVFFGGDIMPNLRRADAGGDFLRDVFFAELGRLREELGNAYPRVFVILGNDDPRAVEASLVEAAGDGLLSYVHGKRESFGRWVVYGYAIVPPSPFLLKDWERYDVSREVAPGCISPEEGWRTVEVDPDEERVATIARDLDALAGSDDCANAVFLFHAPPHGSTLDRIAARGSGIVRQPLDAHVGSIAIRRFIEKRQPLLTLHGHIHESARITGSWRDSFGRTVALSAAHDGAELALVRFDLEDSSSASRELL